MDVFVCFFLDRGHSVVCDPWLFLDFLLASNITNNTFMYHSAILIFFMLQLMKKVLLFLQNYFTKVDVFHLTCSRAQNEFSVLLLY